MPGSLLAWYTVANAEISRHTADWENRRQKPRTGRVTTIFDPIRWQAYAAAADATGPPA